MQPLGRMGQQVAVLVDGAALGWHIAPERSQRLLQPGPAVDHQELRLTQPAPDEIVENGAPRLFARCCCAVSSGCQPNTRFKCSII